MNLAIFHSPGFTNYGFMHTKLEHLTSKLNKILVLCRRRDRLSQRWAGEKMSPMKLFWQDRKESWEEVVELILGQTNTLLVFWGKGDKDKELGELVRMAEEQNKKVRELYG